MSGVTKIKIKSTAFQASDRGSWGIIPELDYVEIDGVVKHDVQSISIKAEAGAPIIATVTYVGVEIDAEICASAECEESGVPVANCRGEIIGRAYPVRREKEWRKDE